MAYVKNYLKPMMKFIGQMPEDDDQVLLWPLSVYREWFYYAKLSGKHESCFKSVPKVAGLLAEYDDAEGFLIAGNGLLLFCEPYLSDAVKLADGEPPVNNHINIDINLNADYDKLVHLFKEFISAQNHALPLSWKTSQAMYTPSVSPKNIKVDNLKRMREVYTLLQQGLTRRQVSEQLGFVSKDVMKQRNEEGLKDLYVAGQYEAAYRKVSRHRAAVEKILKNVARGQFP